MNKAYPQSGGISFHHPAAFWIGTLAVIAGVVAHLPMFIDSAGSNFQMAGMEMNPVMMVGMYGIIAGTILAGYGLYPSGSFARSRRIQNYEDVQVRPLDDAPLSAMHWTVIGALVIALIVDVMKPATLGFVIPGTAEEYGLSRSQVAAMPVAGITGTVIGSLLWGYLGDTIGRRASILLAAIIFIGTAICGAMPSFAWNVVMCFLMGFGAGGMLPIAFALLAEIIPARQRGWLIVLVGGLGTLGGYLAASGSAALLEPHFGWRIMWFLGAPTGLMLIFMNRYIPESPRYLLMHGKDEQANLIMQKFGVRLVRLGPGSSPSTAITDGTTTPQTEIQRQRPGDLFELFRPPHMMLSLGIGLYALAWGLVNFGFLLWLPINLRNLGMGVGTSDAVLAKSALIAFPTTVLVAWLYHKWSTKGTLVLFAVLTVAVLSIFAAVGENLVNHATALTVLVALLLVSSSGVITVLLPYSAEVFPNHIRATGSGWAAGNSKLGGVVALGAALAGLVPGISAAAAIVAVPTLFSALLMAHGGVETRGRRLEEIAASRQEA